MPATLVSLQTVQPRKLAAVRRVVAPGSVPAAFKPALDLVWAFLREHPGLRPPDGHNVFLYRVTTPTTAMTVDFGVEVARDFEPAGEVFASTTPGGRVAQALHIGPYSRLRQTHEAIHSWCRQHDHALGEMSWEVYGDWTDDPSKLETTIAYLLR